MEKVFADYHTHTSYSHGKGTPEQNVLAAIECGLSQIAISEHASAHLLYGVRGERLFALRREIDGLNKRFSNDIKVLMGLECNITGFGECDAPGDADMFDILLLGYHRCVMPKDAYMRSSLFESFRLSLGDPVRSAESTLIAAQKYGINIIAHPGEYIKQDIKTLAKGARELGIALELNSQHLSMSDADIICAAELGAHFVIGSDAHTPERIGEYKNSLMAIDRLGVKSLVDNIV